MLHSYTELAPSFRILEIDSEANEVVDYKQYRLDLIKWNQNTTGPIEWDLAYSFLEVNLNFRLALKRIRNTV